MASTGSLHSGTAACAYEVVSLCEVVPTARDLCRRRSAEARRSRNIDVTQRRFNNIFVCRAWLFVLGLALLSAPVTLHSPARRLQDSTTSTECRASMAAMISDPNWIFMNISQTQWCRVKLENQMANCCTLADFANMRAEGCGEDCEADCVHSGMSNLCNEYFGTTCKVRRVPFRQSANALSVVESFCVPSDCNNNVDTEALMPWYSTSYKAARGGWHLDYDEAELECPSAAVQALLITLGVVLCIAFLLPILYILCVAPKERGRTLVTQAEMQENEDDADGANGTTGNPAIAGPGATQDTFNSGQGGTLAPFGSTQ